MNCSNCHSDISAWLEKYRVMKKIRLDDLYFKDEKIHPKIDEQGYYIEGEKFFEHESKRALERCPKCGKKSVLRD